MFSRGQICPTGLEHLAGDKNKKKNAHPLNQGGRGLSGRKVKHGNTPKYRYIYKLLKIDR